LGIEPRCEIKRNNQKQSQDREVDADGRDPIESAAPLARGSILQHGFSKYVLQRLYFWRGKNDMRPCLRRRFRFFNEQKVLTLH
jgi:hypothetical protein